MECIPEASTMDSNAPDTNFDIDIGSIHTNILTRVNEALSQTGGVEEGSDKVFCTADANSYCDFRHSIWPLGR